MTVPEKDFSTEVVLKPEVDMEAIITLLRAQMEEQGLLAVEFPKCEEFEIAIIRYTTRIKVLEWRCGEYTVFLLMKHSMQWAEISYVQKKY